MVLNVGAPLLARLVTKAGPVYGSFATAAGMFALLYLVGQALVYAAEIAAVRYARLWPRALDLSRPTAADVRALTLLAREQERIPAARVDFYLAAPGCSVGTGFPASQRWPRITWSPSHMPAMVVVTGIRCGHEERLARMAAIAELETPAVGPEEREGRDCRDCPKYCLLASTAARKAGFGTTAF